MTGLCHEVVWLVGSRSRGKAPVAAPGPVPGTTGMPTGPVAGAPPGIVPDVVPLPGTRLGGWTEGWAGTAGMGAEVFGVGGTA